eukprot:5069837-Prymnesium_polylepis.1
MCIRDSFGGRAREESFGLGATDHPHPVPKACARPFQPPQAVRPDCDWPSSVGSREDDKAMRLTSRRLIAQK